MGNRATFRVGDRVRYNNPYVKSAHGLEGEILKASSTGNYEIKWDAADVQRRGLGRDTSHENPKDLVLITTVPPTLSAQSAESIAAYLALDAVEDPVVAAWIAELEAYAKENL